MPVKKKFNAGSTPPPGELVKAARAGDLPAVKALLKRGVAPDEIDFTGDTALMHAANLGHIEIMNLLLDKGADPDKKSHSGNTPLMWAIWGRKADSVSLLLDRGANPDLSSDGDTALIAATRYNNLDIVRLLIDRGADLDKTGDNGKTALELATALGHPATAQVLAKAPELRRQRAEEKTKAAAEEVEKVRHNTVTLKQQRLKQQAQRNKPKLK